VNDRSQVAKRPPPRKIEPGNPHHVGAPMPGVVATVTIAAGARVSRGETLLTLEAMKMQTVVRAEVAGVVAEMLARPGQTVDAKDLLVVLR
jgi:pyruvate carboxylase